MALHLFSARRLAEDLAQGKVRSRDQAIYLIASFLAWTATYYLSLIPSPRGTDPAFFWWLWLVEFVFVVLFTVAGINFCLRKCRIDPGANFLVDFSCLYAPVTLWTIIVVWGVFHVLTFTPVWIIQRWHDAPEQLLFFPWLSSTRAYDLFRLLAYTGMTFFIYLRVGEHMERVSDLRSANSGAQSTTEGVAADAER